MNLEYKPDFAIEADKDIVKQLLEQEDGEQLFGDTFYWHERLLAGIASRKDLFLKAARILDERFIEYKSFREVYALYLHYFKEHRIYLSYKDFCQKVAEDPEISVERRTLLSLVLENSIREHGDISEDEFNNTMDALINRRKNHVFDERVLSAAKLKKAGDIRGADGELRKYLNDFRHLEERSEPRMISSEVCLLEDDDLSRDYCYMTFSDRIDATTGGGWQGETWIVAGYTSDGKTALTKELIFPSLLKGEKVLWVSLEMDVREMVAIFATRIARELGFDLNLNQIRRRDFDSPEQKENFREVMEWIKQLDNLWLYHPEGRFTIRDLEIEIDKLKSKGDLDIVVVDYLELLDPWRKFTQYRLEVKETMRIAKRIASEKNIWLVIPHQISRPGRKAARDRKPYPHYLMSDLQESSGVEQNCVVMVWIYQDAAYRERNRVRIGVSKNRMGKRNELGWECHADFSRCYFLEDNLTIVNKIAIERDAEDEDYSDLPGL